MKAFRLALIAPLALALSACAANQKIVGIDYSRFTQAAPHSVLIVPVVNHSNETQAADLFLTTLAQPLAERGYYVFPTNMAKKLIENEGLSDPGLVHSASTKTMASLFGADTVLYVEILDWKSKYVVTASKIQVKFLYTMKDGHTGDLLWQREQQAEYQYSANSGNIFADLIANAVKSMIDNGRADYTPVAVQANAMALYPAGVGVPFGPYSPHKQLNAKAFPATGSGKLSDAKTVAISYPAEKVQ